jgi:hypothetical protein
MKAIYFSTKYFFSITSVKNEFIAPVLQIVAVVQIIFITINNINICSNQCLFNEVVNLLHFHKNLVSMTS